MTKDEGDGVDARSSLHLHGERPSFVVGQLRLVNTTIVTYTSDQMFQLEAWFILPGELVDNWACFARHIRNVKRDA